MQAEGHGPPVVVMGGSAGAIEAAKAILGSLPEDFPAAVLLVVHLAPTAPSALPAILSRATHLRVADPRNDGLLRPGTLYVAPPNSHLLIRGGRVMLSRGPRENRARPAIDVLFRSAAREAGPRVIGVLLSGGLDDGVAGLSRIKAAGGLAFIQDPEEAVASSMPQTAIDRVPIDLVAPASQIGPALVLAVEGELERNQTGETEAGSSGGSWMDTFELSCPDCAGVLREHEEQGAAHYECQVGHRFSEQTILDAQSDGVESALWMAVRALEERVQLAERLAERFRERGHTHSADRLSRDAHEAALRAEIVRRAISDDLGDPGLSARATAD